MNGRRIVDRELGPTRGIERALRVRRWIVALRWVLPSSEVAGDEEVQVDAVDELAAAAAAEAKIRATRRLTEDAKFRIVSARVVS